MERIDRLLWRCVDGVILCAVLGMICLISLQVGSRLIDASVPWTEELSRFLFIWTVWLGLAASFRAGLHPSLDILPDAAPHFLRRFLHIIQVIATIILFCAISWHGFALLRQQISFGEQSAILQIGMWWATLPLVLGGILSVIGVILNGVKDAPQRNNVDAGTHYAEESLQ